MTARRIASIWFPHFAIERWTKANEWLAKAEPVALVSEAAHGLIIDAVNTRARDSGVRCNQRLADARAVLPPLVALPSDKAGDAEALARLAHWSERWCPFVAVDGADGLMLDLTGVGHLFGGEGALAAEIRARLRAMRLKARVAIAPTGGAAWALARYGPNQQPEGAGLICPLGAIPRMLGPLPVSALRLDDQTVLLLGRLGLKTIAALAAIPTLGLARRFVRVEGPWADPPLRLGQAFGRTEEPVDPLIIAPVPRVVKRVAEPVLDVSVLIRVLRDMAGALCSQLAERHNGARHIVFGAFRIDGEVQTLEARTSQAMRDPEHMLRLFNERLETLEAGFGFDAFALCARWHEPLDSVQAGLIAKEHDETSLARMIDRLSARIGAGNVRLPRTVESHLPERALAWPAALDCGRARDKAAPITAERPIRLFDRPEPIGVTYATPEGEPALFQWRRKLHRIVKAEGPERIAPEWWRERSTTRLRDYYRVEDTDGLRYWIFRNGLLGDGRGGVPEWHLHGLFP